MQIDGTLAAVDATKETAFAEKFEIKGFPTTKYFENGEFKFNVNERTADTIIDFMKELSSIKILFFDLVDVQSSMKFRCSSLVLFHRYKESDKILFT